MENRMDILTREELVTFDWSDENIEKNAKKLAEGAIELIKMIENGIVPAIDPVEILLIIKAKFWNKRLETKSTPLAQFFITLGDAYKEPYSNRKENFHFSINYYIRALRMGYEMDDQNVLSDVTKQLDSLRDKLSTLCNSKGSESLIKHEELSEMMRILKTQRKEEENRHSRQMLLEDNIKDIKEHTKNVSSIKRSNSFVLMPIPTNSQTSPQQIRKPELK